MDTVVQLNVDEVLVENAATRLGLREIHVIRQGAPVSQARWVDMVPGECRELLDVYEDREQEIDLYHLYLFWNAREVIDFKRYHDMPIRYGVLWFVGRDEKVSTSIVLAADLYQQSFGLWPTVAWMRDVRQWYPGTMEVAKGAMVKLEAVEWMPHERYVCVGIPRTEFDPVFDESTGRWR